MIAIVVTGNLGRDAEMKGEMLKFSVASTEKVKGEKVTTWVNCTMWGSRAAALAPYLTKGTKVAVSGSGSLREYETKGEKRASLDVRVDQLDLMGGGQKHEAAPSKPQPVEDMGDELPF